MTRPSHLAGPLLLLAAAASAAQPASAPVRESTDPARAAAIEHAAAELKKRPPQGAVGLVHARTEGGFELLSGGVTVGERSAMQAERARYSLWIATVARPSGAYLADVELRVLDTKTKAAVLERRMEGPWLLVALPEGAYEVSGTFREPGAAQAQTIRTRVGVPKKGQRQAVLRFDSRATTDPDQPDAAKGNPFGAPPAKK